MKKKLISALLSVAMVSALLAGCGSSAGTESSTPGTCRYTAGGGKLRSSACIRNTRSGNNRGIRRGRKGVLPEL